MIPTLVYPYSLPPRPDASRYNECHQIRSHLLFSSHPSPVPHVHFVFIHSLCSARIFTHPTRMYYTTPLTRTSPPLHNPLPPTPDPTPHTSLLRTPDKGSGSMLESSPGVAFWPPTLSPQVAAPRYCALM